MWWQNTCLKSFPKKTFKTMTVLGLLSGGMICCAEKDENDVRLKQALSPSESDARVTDRASLNSGGHTALWFVLPDREPLRAEMDDIENYINGYDLNIWAEAGCETATSLTMKGAYVDNGKVYAFVDPSCDYWLTVSLGDYIAADAALAAASKSLALVGDPDHIATFENEVQPIFAASCTGCHSPEGIRPQSDLSSYETATKLIAGLNKHMTAGTMPPAAPLPVAQSEVVLAWLVDAASGEEPIQDEEPVDTDNSDDAQDASNDDGINQGGDVVAQAFYSYDKGRITQTQMQGKGKIELSLRFKLQEVGSEMGLQTVWFAEDREASRTAVSFRDDIQPVLEEYCVSCHSPGGKRAKTDLTTFENAARFGNGLVKHISEGSMPPSKALNKSLQSVMLQWQEGGFTE